MWSRPCSGASSEPARGSCSVPSGPRELARPGTRVLRPACQKSEGAMGLCVATQRKASHALYRCSCVRRGWTVDSPHSGAPKDGTVSGRKGLGEGWRRPPRPAWGGLGLCTLAIACLPHQSPSCMEARSPAPRERLGCSRCQIHTHQVMHEFKCRA